MATFGIPTIVSDLPVAQYVLGKFENVRFIDESFTKFDEHANALWGQPVPPLPPDFLPSTTCAKEMELFDSLLTHRTRD
jgi:hypothetical protein